MKIVCDSCGAKYQIADEKVQGKVFKIRCKKCSAVIVVNGNEEQDAPSAEYGGAYGATGGAAEWYVVIDGERVGPITPEEVEGYYTTGALTSETFVWRDGLEDWVMLQTLSEFAHLTSESAGPEEKTMIASRSLADGDDTALGSYAADSGFQGGYEEAFEDSTMVMDSGKFEAASFADAQGAGHQRGAVPGAGQSGQNAFAAVESGSYSAVTGGADYGGAEAVQNYGANVSDSGGLESGGFSGNGFKEEEGYDESGYDDGGYDDGGYDDGGYDDGGGMFAAFDSGGSDSGAYEAASIDEGPSLSSSKSDDLVGARNENSVLFSLSSVDQVKAVSKADKPDGQAQGNDKSGLIDIQALASTHAAMSGAGKQDDDDDFVASSMSMPALMPMGTHKSNKGLIVGVSIAGVVLVLGLFAVLFFLILRDDDPTPVEAPAAAVAVAEPTEEENGEEVLSEEEKAAEEAAAAAAQAALEAEEEEEEEEEEEAPAETARADSGSRSAGTTSSRSAGSTASPSTSRTATPTPAPAPTRPPSSAQPDSGGGILDRLDGGGGGTQQAARSNLPESLSNPMVTSTFQRHRTQISRCMANNPEGLSDRAPVRFEVNGDGRVTSARAQGDAAGTTVGRCLESAGQRMRFPETQNGGSFTFPFRF